MHTRTLGQGLQVSAIGYGCMGLSQSYLPVPTREEGIALIRAAADRGVTLFDKLTRLEENLAATDLELTATDLDEIETASAAITLQGARYPRPWSDSSTVEHRTVGQQVRTSPDRERPQGAGSHQ